jgi:transglutaminase-like putative cysteine protease
MRQIRTKVYEWVIGILVGIFGYVPLCSGLTFTPLDRDQAINAAREITAEKYPNAEVVQVDARQWVAYKSDGTYSQWYEIYVKILTEKGRRRYKTVTSTYTIPYNVTQFKLVEVIRSDGSTMPVDIEKNSRDSIEQSQMDANIYDPNSRIMRVSIPELNVGDTVHFILHDEFRKTRMAETFSDYVLFEGTDPIRRSEYTVVAPKDSPLRSIALKAEMPGTITQSKEASNGEITYTWVARDVPQAYEEPQMPLLHTQLQRLLVSTIPDWETVSRWYWNLCKSRIEATNPEMDKTVKSLVAGIKDPEKKIEAIFYWVSQEIRYLGITVEKDAPGYEPHEVSMTFDRRAGICRDKAALLVAMLRLAGFEAYPVLIMNGPKKDAEVPQPFFNHAISCVKNPDGTYLLMDATDENTKELFPAYLNNQSYLVANPRGETLLTSPIISADQNMLQIDTRGTLNEHGNLQASAVISFDGINDNIYRKFFSQLTPEERRQYFEKIVMRTAPGGLLTSFDLVPDDMLDTTQRIEARLGFEVKGWTIPGKDTLMLPLPRFGRSVGMSNILVGKMGLKKRRYPYVTDVACGISERLRLNLGEAAGRVVSLPEYETIDNHGSLWKTVLTMREKTLMLDQTFKLRTPEYTPDEYRELQDTIRKIETDNKKMPIFSLAPKTKIVTADAWYALFQADAVVLDELHEYQVTDPSSWTETRHVKMKVLTYSGKKKYSDIRINYNPAWEKVEVKSAAVTSPAGVKTAVNDKEVNIMDAEWAADAHRYPASKIMVVSLPGVEEGSVIEYTLVLKKTGRPFFSLHGESCLTDHARVMLHSRDDHAIVTMDGVLKYPEPIEKKTVRIILPENMQLAFSADEDKGGKGKGGEKLTAGTRVKVSTHGGKKLYEVTTERVPPVRQEDYLPPWYSFNPTLFASTGSWKAYAHVVQGELLHASSGNYRTREMTSALVKNLNGKREKIKAIRDFVARSIKAIPVPFSELPPDHTVSADHILADGYGSSADRAVVLHAMLTAAGFAPEFVLATWVSSLDELKKPMYEYPAPQWVSDVLVRVHEAGGFIYLNDTDQYAPLGAVKNADHPGLVLAEGRFESIEPLSDTFADRSGTDISILLSEDGSIVMKQKRTYYGNNFASFHKQFSEMPPEERKRHHEQIISSISQSARSAGEYITRYDQYPGVEEVSVQVDSYAVQQGKYLYLKVPGLVNILEGVTSDERKNPLYQSEPRKARITVEVTLPQGMEACEVLPPDGLTIALGKEGSIAMNTSLMEGKDGKGTKTVRITQDINIRPVIVLPSEYPDLLDYQRILSHPKANLLMLKMKN